MANSIWTGCAQCLSAPPACAYRVPLRNDVDILHVILHSFLHVCPAKISGSIGGCTGLPPYNALALGRV